MRKVIKLLMFFVSIFMFATINVNAVETRDIVDSSTLVLNKEDCDSIFGNPNTEGTFGHFLQQIFNVFKYLAPALVIVLSIVEFIKAVASDDKDALLKATKKTGTRIILAIALFFIPTLINFLFEKLGWYGTCNIG